MEDFQKPTLQPSYAKASKLLQSVAPSALKKVGEAACYILSPVYTTTERGCFLQGLQMKMYSPILL